MKYVVIVEFEEDGVSDWDLLSPVLNSREEAFAYKSELPYIEGHTLLVISEEAYKKRLKDEGIE
jgi:hypothetical protein